jgi:hypothetical protein
MKGSPEPKGENSGSGRKKRPTPASVGKAHIDLAKALASVFADGVYNKEELQTAVCTFVAELKQSGESGDAVVRAVQGLGHEIASRFPSSNRTQALLDDMVTWCLAEYYRESA